jgi:hypothetical protein
MRSRVVALGAVAVVAVLVLIVAHHAIASFAVARAIGLATGTSVRFADMHVDASHASITGMHVTKGGEPLFDAASLDVAYRLRDLLPGGKRRYGLESIDVERPVFTLVRHADGSYNLGGGGGSAPSTAPARPATTPLLVRARVRDGEVRLVDEAPLVPDLAAQSIDDITIDASIDSVGRSIVRAEAALRGRQTQTRPLASYPIVVRSVVDVPRDFTMTRATAHELPLRGILDFLIHAPVARFDDGTVDDVNVVAYALDLGAHAPFALQLGGGADLHGARIHVQVLARPIVDVGGRIDLFGDGVTTPGLTGKAAGVPLHVRGGVYDFANAHFQLAIAGNAELDRLKALFAFLGTQPVRGGIHLETLITGKVSDPLIRTALAADRLYYGTIPLDRVHGVVDYDHGGVTFTGVHLGFGPLRATTSGNVDVSTPNAVIEAFVDAAGPASQIPYAQAIAPDATIDGRGIVVGSGSGGFRVGGTVAVSGPVSSGTGYVSVDERGRGEFGPFRFEHRDGSSLVGAFRLERPQSVSAAWIDARNFRLAVPRTLATLPGVAIPPFPQVGGVVDAAVVAGGAPSNFVIAGNVRTRDAAFESYHLGDAQLQLAGTLADLRLQNIRVDGPIGHFRGGGAASGGLFALAGSYDGSLDALAPFTGRIDAHGPVQAPVLALVDARGLTVQTAGAAMAGATIHGLPIDHAAGTLRIDAGGLRIVAADADVLGTHAVAASTDDLVAISAVGLPAAALASAGLPLEAGRISIFGVAGFRGPSFDGSVDLTGGRALGGYPVAGWADLALDGATLGVRDGVGAIGSTYARIGGRLAGLGSAEPRYALGATIALGDVASLTRDLRLPVTAAEGSFSAAVQITGTGGAPTIGGTVEAPEGSYNGLDFADGRGQFALTDADGLRVRVDDGHVRFHATSVAFDAAVGPGSIGVHLASPAANLADFDDFFDESALLDGTGPFAFAFSDDGQHVRTYGHLALTGTRVRRFPLGDVAAIWGTAGGRLRASFATVAPTGRLAASGTIVPAAGAPLDAFLHGDYDADVSAQNVDLGTWLPAVGVSAPVLGRLAAGGHVQGVFPRIAIGGSASIAGGQVGPYPVTTATVRTRILGDHVSIDDALVDLGFVRLTSSGTVGVGPSAPLSLHVHASVPDITAAAAKLVRGGVDAGGSLEADALVAGTLKHPAISAGFDLEAGRYGQFHVQHIIGDITSDLHSVRLDSAEVAFASGTASFAGSLPVTLQPFGIGPRTASFSLNAQARNVDLAPLGVFVPGTGVKLGGTVNGELALAGTVAAPRIYGSGQLTGGSFVSDQETSPIHGLDATFAFGGTSVALTALHGGVGSGTIDASGKLELPIPDAPPTGYSIDLTATGAQLAVPGFGSGSINGDMTIASGRRRPVISGDVTVYDTTIPFATIFRAAGPAEADASAPPFDFGFDLHATAGKNVRVRSAIIDVGATGEIDLTGSLLAPRASGVLTATRGGVFSTYSRLFRIQDATVTFDPAQGIVPNLDLRATAHVQNPDPDTTRNVIGSADITVDVTGPADSFTVAYSSQPAYSQAQIVALLAAIPVLGAVNFDTPQPPGTLRGAPGESNVLLPPGVTPYQTGVYSFQQEAFSLLNTQLTQRFVSPVENAFGNAVGLTDLELTLDYGGRVGYTARKQISAKRQIDVTVGQVLSYPVRTQVGLTARPDAVTSASFSYFTQNGTPSYQNSIFGSTANVQVVNGIQPLSNRQGFSAVLTRRYR